MIIENDVITVTPELEFTIVTIDEEEAMIDEDSYIEDVDNLEPYDEPEFIEDLDELEPYDEPEFIEDLDELEPYDEPEFIEDLSDLEPCIDELIEYLNDVPDPMY